MRSKQLIRRLILMSITLGIASFVSSVVHSSSEEDKQPTVWKLKKTGPKHMGVRTKAPDSLDSDSIIEDQIPPGIPIEVEIKNLKTDSLLHDIEIKVTNAANKPIYFLELGIVLPDNLSEGGYPILFPLRYGRLELIKLEDFPEPNEKPLLPGESVVLKVPGNNLEAFETMVAKGRIAQVKIRTVSLVFHGLNFGDKTGFSSYGSSVPHLHKERREWREWKEIGDVNQIHHNRR
jgi:hypothetical protein